MISITPVMLTHAATVEIMYGNTFTKDAIGYLQHRSKPRQSYWQDRGDWAPDVGWRHRKRHVGGMTKGYLLLLEEEGEGGQQSSCRACNGSN